MNAKQQVTVAVIAVLLIAVVAMMNWSHRAMRPGGGLAADEVSVSVTSPDDMGPGSLREALYIAASAKGRASVRIVTRKLTLKTALPPLMNPHGMQLLAQPPGAVIDARALPGGAVLDVVGANTSIEGVVVRNCSGTAVLLRAAHFRMHATAIESCAVGVEVVANAADVLLEDNRFTNDGIGVRFAAPNPDAAVVGNTFAQAKAAGLWAVRGDPGVSDNVIGIRDNHFTDNHSGVVAGNISIDVEHNEFSGNAPDAAVHLIGAGAVIRNNRIHGTATTGIVAENARAALIEGNELDGLSSYAIMLRGSAGAMVRANRVADCASGMAFVLGDPGHPSTAIGNTIAAPTRDGIDVIGDSPILKDNQVLHPHALALRVMDYAQGVGPGVRAQPSLQGNNFRANTIGTLAAAESTGAAGGKP
jgi:Right handed beta helix region